MQRVTERVLGHQLMPHICFDDLGDGVVNLQEPCVVYQQKGFFLVGIIAARQFIKNSFACYQQIVLPVIVPPVTSPITAGNHVRSRSSFMVEAGNGRFYVDLWLHSGKLYVDCREVKGFALKTSRRAVILQ